MIAKLYGSALYGVEAFRITIEVSVSNGMGYMITGLPDDAVKESLTRIAIALDHYGFRMPRTKLVINLSPADIRKSGSGFDLPIAIGILLASGAIEDLNKLKDYWIIGELGLDGNVLPVRGALCMAIQAHKEGVKGLLLPAVNAEEAALIAGIDVYGIRHLQDIIDFIQSDCALLPALPKSLSYQAATSYPDFKDVKGQSNVKRAMEIAAAGGHNSLLIGPPGIGKTMLAKRLPSILPPMSLSESLETTQVYSVLNNATPLTGLVTERPFRNPHHSSSDIALIGGGAVPMPGEISQAHNGVLFLDELPEFKRAAIEALRQPLEERKVSIARTKAAFTFPASFMLLASMNPCLCGYFGHPSRACTCSKRAAQWYRRKVSGPILERIDLHIEAESLPLKELFDQAEPSESSDTIRQRVIHARYHQYKRYQRLTTVHCNAHIPDEHIETFCPLEPAAKRFVLKKMEEMQLSVRSYARILKVARTIADLAGKDIIELAHVAEAIHFRCLDKPLTFPLTPRRR